MDLQDAASWVGIKQIPDNLCKFLLHENVYLRRTDIFPRTRVSCLEPLGNRSNGKERVPGLMQAQGKLVSSTCTNTEGVGTYAGKRLRVGIVAARPPHKQATERRGTRAWRDLSQSPYPLRAKSEYLFFIMMRLPSPYRGKQTSSSAKSEYYARQRILAESSFRDLDHLSIRVVMVILSHRAR